MGNRIETIILRLSKENEKMLREKAIKENITIEEYIKKICIYDPWLENYEEWLKMDFFSSCVLHKLFIVLYSILIIYGFYLVLKEKSDIEKRIKDKINKQYKREITLEVDEEEKYMLRNLATDYGYSNIEEFMVSILNKEIDIENYDHDEDNNSF